MPTDACQVVYKCSGLRRGAAPEARRLLRVLLLRLGAVPANSGGPGGREQRERLLRGRRRVTLCRRDPQPMSDDVTEAPSMGSGYACSTLTRHYSLDKFLFSCGRIAKQHFAVFGFGGKPQWSWGIGASLWVLRSEGWIPEGIRWIHPLAQTSDVAKRFRV
jgi:hypothetical protein